MKRAIASLPTLDKSDTTVSEAENPLNYLNGTDELCHGSLVVEDGVSVLWATHLIDEVADDDDIVVLHHGRVLAHGAASRIVQAADARDIRAAFTRLTQEGEPQAAHEVS